jgi:two-component system, OmpR family, heavy metal sensor histidine kinase CusS
MFSNPSEPRSIATELVLLFTLAAAILLGSALGGFYWLVVRHAFAEDNAVLRDKMRALQAELRESDGLKTIGQELKSRRVGEPAAYWVRVLEPDSRIAVETPRMGELLPITVFSAATSSASLVPKDYRTEQRLFSLIAANESVDGRLYTIQVAQDRSEDERFRTKFGALLLLTLGLGTIAFTVIAITVTSRGLRPLREMARLVGRVSPSHLNERLMQIRWPAEIKPLAAAFDEMLTRLEDSFTRLSQFSADLAHELRTPVANLLGEAQVALTRTRSAEEYRAIIESSVAECERLSGLVDNLLFLARAEAADGHIQRTKFDGKLAVEKIAALYEPVAEEQQITISCQGEAEIYADPMLFGRAINNLMENALRYTSAGGSIVISIIAGPIKSEISVKDTGCGIAAEHLPRVWDRFYRADSSRSSAGVGLGLALVKSIADLHGGSAIISSQVNRGTTVTITFPNKAGLNPIG